MSLNKDGSLPINKVVFSVSDKGGIADLALALREVNPDVVIYGTPGSQSWLDKAGLTDIKSISELTGAPAQSFKHRMSSISYPYESSLLFNREDPDQVQEAIERSIPETNMVICNLYPFEEAIARAVAEGKKGEELRKVGIENIDVGGPCMVRAAAKNCDGVVIVPDPKMYPDIIAELKETGAISRKLRHQLAVAAFDLTAEYDAAIAAFLLKAFDEQN